MGYKFQFVTLAGFHSLNLSMFELAQGYHQSGMSAYSQLQQREFACEGQGYGAAKHQRFVGTGYFDEITKVVGGGTASTTALTGSTEEEQFGTDQHKPVTAPMPPAVDIPAPTIPHRPQVYERNSA